MAGAGYRTFTRETLASSIVQTYLMDQAVQAYANSAARAAAIPAPSAGMVSILLDGPGIPDIYVDGAWRPLSSVNGATTQTASFAVNSTSETRMTGTLNVQYALRTGRLYRLSSVVAVTGDANDQQPQMRWRGAAGVLPTTASGCIAEGYTQLQTSGRTGSLHCLGHFGVGASGTYWLSPFVRRLNAAGTNTFGPDTTGVMQVAVQDCGAYVSGFPLLS